MIEVKHGTKRYPNVTAVDNISFEVKDGEVVGFLGPNGAGKSTTMNMLTGFIEPTEGQIIINGYDISKKAKKAKKQIGYMPEGTPLYMDLTAKEFINYMAELKMVKAKERKGIVEKVIKEMKLKKQVSFQLGKSGNLFICVLLYIFSIIQKKQSDNHMFNSSKKAYVMQ